MAGQNIAEILGLPFDPKFFRDYLNNPDPELKAAARRVKALRDSGSIDGNFRTTKKYDEQQSLAERQREQAITQAQQVEANRFEPPSSPFGPLVEEQAATVRAEREAATAKTKKQQQAANAAAERRGDPLPYPDAGVAGAPAPGARPAYTTMSPREAERIGDSPWASVSRILTADPMAWDTNNETLFNQDGQASYILVRNGRAEVVSQAQYRAGLNTASIEERKRDQQFMKQFWGSRYKGPTDGSLDPSGTFQNAMEQYAAYSTKRNYYQFAAGQGDPVKFKPLDDKALVGMSGGAGGMGAVSTQRTVTYQDFTDDEASAILEDFYRDALGRRPNKKESQKFAELLRKRAAEKPSVVTSTSGGGTTTVREQAGFGTTDAQMLARQQAEARPGFKPYQLGTKAFDGFMAALQSPFG